MHGPMKVKFGIKLFYSVKCFTTFRRGSVASFRTLVTTRQTTGHVTGEERSLQVLVFNLLSL